MLYEQGQRAILQWTVSIHCMVQCPAVREWPSVVSYWPCPLSQLSTLVNFVYILRTAGCCDDPLLTLFTPCPEKKPQYFGHNKFW